MLIKLGIEKLLEDEINVIKGKRIGLLTNMTGVDSHFNSTIDLLHHCPDAQLVALFGPEHGIRGDAREGTNINSYTDPITNIPVFSLYGETNKPSKEILKNIDSIVVDIQDIGVRYYTYISTLGCLMEACMEQKKEVIVLDRPNPINGIDREGIFIEKPLRTFVGMYPVLNRHGLTIGEIALLYKYEFGLDCKLSVVHMEGWKRSMFFRDTGLIWIQPSPNSTGESMNILYPGMCLIEGTNLSEGRGTTRPFEVVGAPYIDGNALADRFNKLKLPGIVARPTSFVPTYSKYEDQLCYGVQLHVINLGLVRSLKATVHLLGIIANMYPNSFLFKEEANGQNVFDHLSGHAKLRKMVLSNFFDEFFVQCQQDCEHFLKQIAPYLIYK